MVILESMKDAFVSKILNYLTVVVKGTVLPGVRTSEQGSGSWRREIATGKMIVIHNCTFSPFLQIWHRFTRVPINRHVLCRKCIEKNDQNIWLSILALYKFG